jgi:hypothetical protein
LFRSFGVRGHAASPSFFSSVATTNSERPVRQRLLQCKHLLRGKRQPLPTASSDGRMTCMASAWIALTSALGFLPGEDHTQAALFCELGRMAQTPPRDWRRSSRHPMRSSPLTSGAQTSAPGSFISPPNAPRIFRRQRWGSSSCGGMATRSSAGMMRFRNSSRWSAGWRAR